ncbi:toll-like receptor 13 [Hyperolius riggenbachi]|uniref:toll-like receptor 13 n=1 Tax=Hyperolius riggenbachi TaxID=752182 RepID=UPI0035A3A2A4
MDLNFEECEAFEDLDFSIGVYCGKVESLHDALKEVPLETDWLCLKTYHKVTLEEGAFSLFTRLRSLYIAGNMELLPGAFSGLPQLSILWIGKQDESNNITFHEDALYGLNSLQELKIFGVNLSEFSTLMFEPLHLLENLVLEQSGINNLSEVTTSLKSFKHLHKLSIIGSINLEFKQTDCLTTQYFANHGGSLRFVDFNISYLDLSQTKFSTVEDNSLCNFPHLQVFHLEKSGFEMEDFFKSGIKTIKTISFPRNGVTVLDICKLASHFKTEELLLGDNGVHRVVTSTGSCKHVTKLDLSFNYLTKITVNQRFPNLLELDLASNEMLNLNICANESVPVMKLVYLNVSFNYLLSLHKGQFACLKDLKVLSLENNKINHIQDLAFDGLEKLQVLNLQYNSLFVIGEYTLENLFVLTHLNLYGNMIQSIDGEAFKHLFSLVSLELTYNIATDFYWWQNIQESVMYLSLKADILQLSAEEVGDFPFLETFSVDSTNTVTSCSKFTGIKELHLKNLLLFKCDEDWGSPFRNYTNLKKLYYTGNREDFSDPTLSNTLKYVPQLNFLYLQDTDKMVKYGQLNAYEMFCGLSHLKFLHLKNSGIDYWDFKDLFNDLHELEFLLVENQNIQVINETVFETMPNLKYIYFLQTTFPCSCKFTGMLSWVESSESVSIIDFSNQECLINNLKNNFVDFLHTSCLTNLDMIMFLLTFFGTLLFMVISLFYETILWYIVYAVYTVKCWLNRRNHNRRRDHYEYDVFVSYSVQNELWVVEQLLPSLEVNGPPFFKVCIHNRDFEVGRDILENIVDSIYNSRWTVCVVSHHYLQSNWCSLEMRMATYRLLSESKDSLILVFLDKINKEELQYYHRLIKLLDKKTHLEWPDDKNGQELFWARLREVIAKSGRDATMAYGS